MKGVAEMRRLCLCDLELSKINNAEYSFELCSKTWYNLIYRHYYTFGIILIDHKILRLHPNPSPDSFWLLFVRLLYEHLFDKSSAHSRKILPEQKNSCHVMPIPYIYRVNGISTRSNAPEKGVSPCCSMQPYDKILPPSYVLGGSIVVVRSAQQLSRLIELQYYWTFPFRKYSHTVLFCPVIQAIYQTHFNFSITELFPIRSTAKLYFTVRPYWRFPRLIQL